MKFKEDISYGPEKRCLKVGSDPERNTDILSYL